MVVPEVCESNGPTSTGIVVSPMVVLSYVKVMVLPPLVQYYGLTHGGL